MDLVPNSAESPRLLTTAAIQVRKSGSPEDDPNSNYKLKGASLFSGNGRAIFIGIFLGAVVISGGGYLFSHRQAARRDLPAPTESAAVPTPPAPMPIPVPPPVIVQINPQLLRVTAIALGNPRLAVINGQVVTEGDIVVLRPPTLAPMTVTLRVAKIGEGSIDLTDGSQIVSTRLRIPEIGAVPSR